MLGNSSSAVIDRISIGLNVEIDAQLSSESLGEFYYCLQNSQTAKQGIVKYVQTYNKGASKSNVPEITLSNVIQAGDPFTTLTRVYNGSNLFLSTTPNWYTSYTP